MESDRCASTPSEAWTLVKPGSRLQAWKPPIIGRQMYTVAAEFVKDSLGEGNGKSCLVVGSPIFEALELIERGWDVTYLDVRVPPIKFEKFVQCDAASMPFPDESFDALSSTCVLSHVGLGRYGDPLVEQGDEKALNHMARVLKKGSRATIMFGNVANMSKVVRIGTCHRVYTLQECHRMLKAANLEVEKTGLWSLGKRTWIDLAEMTDDYVTWPDYITFLVRKC